MSNPDHRAVSQRFATALELYQLGEAMLRQRIRRQHPGASDAEVEAQVLAWLEKRPGAEHGDCTGRPRPWPPAADPSRGR